MQTDTRIRRAALLTPGQLLGMIDSAAPPRILAVQSINPYTGANSQTGQWIPGAVDVDVYSEFAAPESKRGGQRPLPEIGDLQKAARRLGLTHDRTIVLYDNDRAMTAARGWWVLRWAGFTDVRVLDGGLPAWIAAGLPVVDVPEIPAKTGVNLTSGHMREFGAAEACEFVDKGILLDARIRPNYIGGPEQGGDPTRGHIPGAISSPTPDNLTDPGPFTDSETLVEMYLGLGVAPGSDVGVYCGAGMSAAHTVLALAAIGIDAAMYPGSWSQWVSDSTRPVKRGPFP
jgi:thiosulfate/3-mercaptopyruvate sulfurtransferase